VTNTARVTSLTPDPDMSNNFTETFLAVTGVTNLALTKTATGEEQQVNQPGLIFNNAIFGQVFPTAPNYFASTRVTAGRRIEYRLTVSNTGPSRAERVVLQDRLPGGVRIYQGSVVATLDPAGAAPLVTLPAGTCATGTPGDPLDKLTCGLGTRQVGDVARWCSRWSPIPPAGRRGAGERRGRPTPWSSYHQQPGVHPEHGAGCGDNR
jgi:uncharacterized repeat protein (TIGR01451 family)